MSRGSDKSRLVGSGHLDALGPALKLEAHREVAGEENGDGLSGTSVVAGVVAVAPARGSPGHSGGSCWTRGVIFLLTCGGIMVSASVLTTLLVVAEFHHVYFNRDNLPDLGPFTRFEFSTIGHVYDAGGRPLIEFAREYREIARYDDIPPIVRDAILAAEDKRFFSHNGNVIKEDRARLGRGGRLDENPSTVGLD